jgi:hypothetical protein
MIRPSSGFSVLDVSKLAGVMVSRSGVARLDLVRTSVNQREENAASRVCWVLMDTRTSEHVHAYWVRLNDTVGPARCLYVPPSGDDWSMSVTYLLVVMDIDKR